MSAATIDRLDYVFVPVGDSQPRPASSVGGDRVEMVIRTTLAAAVESIPEALALPPEEQSPVGSVRFEGLLLNKKGDQVDDEINLVISVSREELTRLNAAASAKRRLAGAARS